MTATTATLGSETLAEKTIGYRTVMNTVWGRCAELLRTRRNGRHTGFAVQVICNGINDSYQTFRRREEAEAYYADLGPHIDRAEYLSS